MYVSEIIPSEPLIEFLRCLMNGPDSRRVNTLTKQRRIQSRCVICCHRWEKETQKTSNARVGNEKVDQQSKSYRYSK